MIVHLSYVICEGGGYACPAGPPGDDAKEARQFARRDGWARRDGKDLCPNCKNRSEVAR